MAAQPREEDIEQVMMVMGEGVSRQEAIARLKGNNNNADQAINEYYDDMEGSTRKYRWDESHFHADRDGADLIGSQGVTFQVQGPDELAPAGSARYDGSMSRPPSRVNNRSPLGKVIDLTAEQAGASAENPMYFNDSDQGDAALQQALAASRVEAGLPPQESGVTNSSDVHFGPATRDQYESGKWEMVPMSAGRVTTQEILIDPEPAERKRDLNVPAFLKPSVKDHRLAGLITMYHEIPMTRELFIDRNNLLPTYGNDAEWWNGQPIKLDSVDLEEEQEFGSEVNAELQRLMAFLDKTDRSYGSVEPLANIREVKQAQRQSLRFRDTESAVLAAWKYINDEKPGRVKQIFSKGVQSESQEDEEGEVFAILELTLPSKDSYSETIYDVADNLLWPEFGPSDVNESAYLSHVADVIVFNISAESDDYKPIDVPPIWYPDRYTQQHRQAAWEMRKAKREIHDSIQNIEAIEDQLTKFQSRNGKIIDVKTLLKASLRHDEAEVDDRESNGSDAMDVSFHQSSKSANLTGKLQQLVASIDKKLQGLNEEKEKTLASMRKLSQLLTVESDEPNAPKLTKYFLRGVSVSKDVTYICRRAEPDLIEMDLDEEHSKDRDDQWWRCGYIIEGGNPQVEVHKTTHAQVMQAAKTAGTSKVLLMYASEKAMDWPVTALPPALETFVRWDNACFKREFSQSSEDQVSSPGKRKFDDSDASSPLARESDREYRLNGEPQMGWGSAQSASRDLNSKLNGVQEDDELVTGDSNAMIDGLGEAQEMKERHEAPLLSQMRSKSSDALGGTIDSMDLDDTVMDDANTVEPSPAVKDVGLRE